MSRSSPGRNGETNPGSLFCFFSLNQALPDVSIFAHSCDWNALPHQALWKTDLVIRKWCAEPMITGTRLRGPRPGPSATTCSSTGPAHRWPQRPGLLSDPGHSHRAPQPPPPSPLMALLRGSLLKGEVSMLNHGKNLGGVSENGLWVPLESKTPGTCA